MLPTVYPKIEIYWAFEKDKQKEYKEAFSKLVVGQLDCVGNDTVGVAIVEGIGRAIPIIVDDGYIFSQMAVRLSTMILITDFYFFPVIGLEKYTMMQW